MLKKAGNITLILLLLVATGGMPVTRHYCGSLVRSFAIYSTPKACCSGHCDKCHNVFKFSKVKDNFEAGSTITAQSLTDFVTLHASFFIDLFDNATFSPLAIFVSQRAVNDLAAGHSPASYGNLRC